MKNLLFVFATLLITTSAFAQSAFEGFYGQIATGYEKNSYTSINPSWSVSLGSTGTGSAPNQSSSGAPGERMQR
jgi:outer membrane immunogenic protein